MQGSGPRVVRRLGLIGDVHAEDERLRVAITALLAEKVERILCCGDLVDGHGDVDRTCSTLALHGVITVRGNHDRWIRDDDNRLVPNAHSMTALAPLSIDLLKSLPRTVSIVVPGGRLLLCHGIGENDMRQLGPDDGGYAISSNDDLLKVLFDANRTTAHSMTKLLRFAWQEPGLRNEFVAQLSIGGVDGTLHKRFRELRNHRAVRAKTGTLDDSIALSGYVLGPQGKSTIAFAILFNKVSGRGGAARAAADKLVDLIHERQWK